MVTTALREKMRAILRARNYSPRTEETYVAAVIHFARHFGTPPDQLGAEHVIAYQVWMRDQKCASHVLHNQPSARCGSSTVRFSTGLTSWNAFAMHVASVGYRWCCRSRRRSRCSVRSIILATASC